MSNLLVISRQRWRLVSKVSLNLYVDVVVRRGELWRHFTYTKDCPLTTLLLILKSFTLKNHNCYIGCKGSHNRNLVQFLIDNLTTNNINLLLSSTQRYHNRYIRNIIKYSAYAFSPLWSRQQTWTINVILQWIMLNGHCDFDVRGWRAIMAKAEGRNPSMSNSL